MIPARFTLLERSAGRPAATEAQGVRLHLTCECGATMDLPGSAAGRRARCTSCGTVFTVPAPDSSRSMPEPTAPPEASASGPPRHADRDAVLQTPLSFWHDLGLSFVFVFFPDNLFALLVLAVIPVGLGFLPLFGWALAIVFWFYLFAFYLAVIPTAASGEDTLPRVWIDDIWGDLIRPIFQFLGTWLVVLLPAIVVRTLLWEVLGGLRFEVLYVSAAAGLFLWPAVVLMVAIGNSFSGLWPHLVVRTALAAPLAYVASCAVLLVAAGLAIVPETDWYYSLYEQVSFGRAIGLELLSNGISLYAALVAMRTIGLYYRHYKADLPWQAE